MAAAFQDALMWAPGMRIAGGTDEILKNISAERVLGLPGDIRVDKDVPFKGAPVRWRMNDFEVRASVLRRPLLLPRTPRASPLLRDRKVASGKSCRP